MARLKTVLLMFILLLLTSILVTSQKEKHAHDADSNTKKCVDAATASVDREQAQENCAYTHGYTPSWEAAVAFRVFGWPEGITAWALFATLAVIGWQSHETEKSANASGESVRIANITHEVMRNKEKPRISVTPQAAHLDGRFPAVNFMLTFRVPIPAYGVVVKTLSKIRQAGSNKTPELLPKLPLPDIYEESVTEQLKSAIAGEGTASQLSASTIERLELGELEIFFMLHVAFADAYGVRDFMYSSIYRASGMRNMNGTPHWTWSDGPRDLNWDK